MEMSASCSGRSRSIDAPPHALAADASPTGWVGRRSRAGQDIDAARHRPLSFSPDEASAARSQAGDDSPLASVSELGPAEPTVAEPPPVDALEASRDGQPPSRTKARGRCGGSGRARRPARKIHLFPAYATQEPGGGEWRVQVHGWCARHSLAPARPRRLTALPRRVFDPPPPSMVNTSKAGSGTEVAQPGVRMLGLTELGMEGDADTGQPRHLPPPPLLALPAHCPWAAGQHRRRLRDLEAVCDHAGHFHVDGVVPESELLEPGGPT